LPKPGLENKIPPIKNKAGYYDGKKYQIPIKLAPKKRMIDAIKGKKAGCDQKKQGKDNKPVYFMPKNKFHYLHNFNKFLRKIII